jgi:predicted ATPase
MCLVTLFLQPDLPELVLLDEPELGLHPAAIGLVAALLRSASARTQIVAATQSVTLVNQFDPEHIWAVDRPSGPSQFKQLDSASLAAWLEDFGSYDGYSLGELWEKNILGARP